MLKIQPQAVFIRYGAAPEIKTSCGKQAIIASSSVKTVDNSTALLFFLHVYQLL